ncbi:hypothetical protein [Antarcticimicrobium luteum]|uniref:Uncharacterized protein n=1 Tax=Antarcticimicrobium luteum TaxID=2547397 RepID=A0A4R5VFR2_9RHOB|nr:hypothetical protein [Antarcticimicrobium luteum]TDK50604.1 hypothetical protein E1832_06180 [Antarcticimicrobium luteum]
MSRARIAYWAVFMAALALYAAMVGGTLPAIARDAGGLTPFDMRPMGYTVAEARAFLAALGDEGRALYLGPQRWLDLAYPVLLAIVLIGAVRMLIRRFWLQLGLSLAALGGMAADYLENARVAAMLVAGGAVADELIGAASRATQLKAGLTSLVMLAVCVALARAAWKRWRTT